MNGRNSRAAVTLFVVAALCGCGGSSPGWGATRHDATRAAQPAHAESSSADEAGGVAVATGGEAEWAPPPAEASGDSTPRVVPVSPGSSTSTTITTTTTITVEDVAPMVQIEPVPQQVPQYALLTAASVGDHDRRGPYLQFLQRHPYEARRVGLDMSRRVRFSVQDAYGRPVGDARIELDGAGVSVEGRTHGDGVWDFYPGVSMPGRAGRMRARIQLDQLSADTLVDVPAYGDGQDITVRFTGVAAQPAPVLDLAFVIDVTGSMGDELRYVNAEVVDITRRVRDEVPEVTVRVGAVFFRDRTDSLPLQQIQMTTDVEGFAQAMLQVQASGGGDYPEDIDSGLAAAMNRLAWTPGAATRVAVLIGDAPPHRYQSTYTYRHAMIDAAARGIRILPVAASGANREVEFLFRALGAFTSTPYVYLTDDSGVGNPHLEADTDRVAVEYFADLLSRLLISDLRGQGMHEPGPFGPNGRQ